MGIINSIGLNKNTQYINRRKWHNPLWLSVFGSMLLMVGCDRIVKIPPPEGVPESAQYDKVTGIWSDRKETGVQRSYYEDGDIAVQGKRVNGQRTGVWRTFTPGGVVASEGEFKDDWRDGTWNFFDDQGELYLKIQYTEGPTRSFGFIVTHNYGNENGPYERYYPDGSLEERGEFHGGYFEGPVIRYYPDGKTALKGQFSGDKKNGLWRYYYPGGQLMKEETYKNGILNGPVRVFHEDGRVYHQSLYISGERTDVKIMDRRIRIEG